MIDQDLARTFSYFSKSADYGRILLDARACLGMFVLHRPDVGYVQGMNYLIVVLLLLYPPYYAFKLFSNLIVNNRFLYDVYTFDTQKIEEVGIKIMTEVAQTCPKVFSYFIGQKVSLWNVMWVEWVYSLFFRTFDLKTAFVLFDHFLVYGEALVFNLSAAAFELMESMATREPKFKLIESYKTLILSDSAQIISNAISKDFKLEYSA